ncbi:MAG: HNH endonuclease signature motif containing protein [Rhodococcus sp. (in: high G+C Gram-positive bacteria)]
MTAGILADHYKKLIETDPARTNAEYPDGHGGHTTPPPGALRYTPSAALAQWVRAQYPTCRFPGCAVQSSRCDLDHIVGFDHKNPEQGGWTISSNLAPFCRTHHNLKTSKLWPTEKLPDDVLHITDPHGSHYFSPPEL